MGIFDNQNYYNREEYDKLSFTVQKDLFLRIRTWVATVDKEVRYNNDLYRKTIIKKIEQICSFACAGHIPAQDYMGYIYKRGFGDFFPTSYRRALEWNIIAAANCSKLAPDKMKTFLNPAVDLIFECDRIGQIIKFNELNKSNYFWFLSQYVCDLLIVDMKLNPAEMATKQLIEEDSNENKAIIYLDRLRDRVVRQAIDKLIKALPPEMAEEDIPFTEDMLDPQSDDFSDIDINIDDI